MSRIEPKEARIKTNFAFARAEIDELYDALGMQKKSGIRPKGAAFFTNFQRAKDEIERLEAVVETLEARISVLEQHVNSPAHFVDD